MAQKLGLRDVYEKFGEHNIRGATAGNTAVSIGAGSYWYKEGLNKAFDYGKKGQYVTHQQVEWRDFPYLKEALEIKTPYGSAVINRETGGVTYATVLGKNAGIDVSVRDAFSKQFVDSLTAKTDFVRQLMSSKDFSKNFNVSKGFADELRDTATLKALTELTQNTQYEESISDTTRRELFGLIQGKLHTPSGKSGIFSIVSIEGGGGYRISGVTEDGKQYSVTLTDKEAKAFEEAFQKAAVHTLRREMSTTEGIRYAQQIAESAGLMDEAKRLKSLTTEEALSATHRIDLMPSLVKKVMEEKYSNLDSATAATKAIEYIYDMSPDEFRKRVEALKESMYGDFLKEKKESIQDTVDKKIGDQKDLQTKHKKDLEKAEKILEGVNGKGYVPEPKTSGVQQPGSMLGRNPKSGNPFDREREEFIKRLETEKENISKNPTDKAKKSIENDGEVYIPNIW